MKRIPLSIIELPDGEPMSYREQYLRVLRAPKAQHGTDYAEMLVVLPLIEKLEAAPENTAGQLLEDAEWKELRDRLTATRWGLNAPEIYDMIRAVVEAETVSVTEVKDVAAST